ncbi:7-carboxy-7-deazaguanine synthase QueE [Thalassoroseus pseudoceratinae]|uniref:7-carboxy-7-deazaguanine synthase QueE n=1 Tax=Thalassoroseus pseudoceratinae TaxID=2713176 RepID=UPI0014249211|nr:7-carboxy-7-deazaguanine synthase QueE [Thalassoroseus pseudoceratinae]
MFISELFESIQGEGRYVGVPSVFLRTSGCNLRCWFCDTPETSWEPRGQHMPLEDVTAKLLESECDHAVLTGGEPLLVSEMVPLTESLSQAGKVITIETAGTVFLPVQADLISLSPKLANSTPSLERSERWHYRHEELRHQPDVIQQFVQEYDYQIKFVVDRPEDINDVLRWCDEFPTVTPDHVYLMAQAIEADVLQTKNAWLNELAETHGFQVSPRLHIELFGHTPGT